MMLPFPKGVFAQHTILLGKTRSGKSSTMRVMVESLLDDKKPVSILDPKGDWWGIKSSADGKKAGYNIVIFGGEHADIAINPQSGKVVAELVATGNRPALIDLGGWMVSDRTKFFIEFASTLFIKTHGHRWLAIDECHNFAPKGKILDPQAGMSLHWANRLASEGAGKGLVLISASQRPQKVHNDYLTSHETLIAKRVIHKADRDALKDWIDACGDEEQGKELMRSIAGIQRSQGWVYSPEIDFGPKLVDFPMFATYDSFKPQTGRVGRRLKGWASVDLDEVKEKLAAVVEENKARDPAELRKQIVEKDRKIADLEKEAAAKSTAKAKPDKDAIATAEKRGHEQKKKQLVKAAEKAVRDAMLNFFQQLAEKLKPLDAFLAEAEKAARTKPFNLANDVRFAPAEPPAAPGRHVAALLPQRQPPGQQKPVLVPRPAPPARAVEGDGAPGAFTRAAERKVMMAIAQYPEGRTKKQAAVLAGYALGGGGFNNALGKLRANGFITGSDLLQATPEGLAALGDFEPLPTGAELLGHWMRQLKRKAEREVLQAVVIAYPNAISVEETAATAGYVVGTGGFNNALGKLRTLELISGKGELRASDELFGVERAA